MHDGDMKFVTYNIQYGKGRDGAIDLSRIASAVRGADIVALQEVERYISRSGDVDQPGQLAELMPEHRWIYGANLDVSGDTTDAKGRPVYRWRQIGNMILSRRPILSARNFPLPKSRDGAGMSIQCGVLETVIETPRGGLRAYSTHLCSLSPATRMLQVEAVRDLLTALPQQGSVISGAFLDPEWIAASPSLSQAVILAGDFNFEPNSAEYGRTTTPLQDARKTLVDAWVAAGNQGEDGISFVSMDNRQRQRLDYAFLTRDLAERVTGARVDHAAEGSDHYPVWIEFDWEAAGDADGASR